ncbi:MAG: hypothetical protein GY723_02835 [bacterium]|nr:hypothetical protein [bacterium]MCP5067196.1 hypothetical protein [bacterium]
MPTFSRHQIAEILEIDEGFLIRLETEEILFADAASSNAPYTERMLERARVAHSLAEELEVNLPGVAVIVRLREELGTSRARIDALVRALRGRGFRP